MRVSRWLVRGRSRARDGFDCAREYIFPPPGTMHLANRTAARCDLHRTSMRYTLDGGTNGERLNVAVASNRRKWWLGSRAVRSTTSNALERQHRLWNGNDLIANTPGCICCAGAGRPHEPQSVLLALETVKSVQTRPATSRPQSVLSNPQLQSATSSTLTSFRSFLSGGHAACSCSSAVQ